MRRRAAVFVAVAVLLAVMTGMSWRWASSFVRKSQPALAARPPLTASVTQLPLAFEPNQGQFDPRVLYAAHTSDGTLFFTSDGLTLALPRFASEPVRFPDPRARLRLHPAIESIAALRLAFDGANPAPDVVATDQQPGIKNYLIGRDPQKWHTHVPIFGKVTYRDLYPGIDLVFYGGKSGLLEYDLDVSPGADPGRIRFRFEGAERTDLDEGALLIHAGPVELRQPSPHVYTATIPRHEVPVSYRVDQRGWIGLDVTKRDARDGLRIDPVLAYSTYLGGSGAGGAGDVADGIAIDLFGSVYVTGQAASIDYPTTDGSLQPENLTPVWVSWDAGLAVSSVTKLDPAGASLVYSTFIGGKHPVAGWIGDGAAGVVVTDGGFAYVAGQTGTTDFPVTNGGAQTIFGGQQDGYVLELTPEGDGLVYSTLLGGTDVDVLDGLDLDAEGNAYVGGFCTGNHFPVTNALQQEGTSAGSAILAKLSPDGSRFLYASYFGGSGSGSYSLDQILGVKVDTNGDPVYMGYAGTDDLPGHGMSPVPFHGGGGDVFATKLSSDGQSQMFFTYLGGSGLDFGWDLKLDQLGDVWIVGQTGSSDFPVTGGAFQHTLISPATSGGTGPFDAFVAALDPSGILIYASYLGGNGDDRAVGVAVDSQGHVHVAGVTSSTDLMVNDAVGGEHDESLGLDQARGNGDMFVADFTRDGGLDFLTYLGGSGSEPISYSSVGIIAVDSLGGTYIVGNSASDDFPVTSRAFQKKNNMPTGVSSIVVAKIVPTPPPSTLISLSSISGPTTGVPVEFAAGTNMSGECDLDFGGTPSGITVATAHQLQVSVEPHACGTVDVTLLCPGSPISVLPQGFTFSGCDGGVDVGSSDGGSLPAPTYGCGFGSSGASGFESLLLSGVLLALFRRARSRQGQTSRRT